MNLKNYFYLQKGQNAPLLWKFMQIKPSDYFNSMDEIKTFVENNRPNLSDEEYHMLKAITGLSDQEGDFEELDGIGQIDKSIVPIILYLNQKNILTNSSCSGIRKEHPKWKNEEFSGYISIIDDGNEKAKDIIKNAALNLAFSFNEEEAYLKPVYTIRIKGTDEYKLKAWNQLLENLIRRL